MWKKLLINGFIATWAIAAGVFVSLKPWQVYQRQNEEAKHRIKEERDAEARRDQLITKEARAESSIGREELARKAGYVGSNEVVENK